MRQDKSRSSRVTPSAAERAADATRQPVKVGRRFSSVIPVLMVALMVLGTAIILANYLVVGFGAPSNWYLLTGLGFILAGIVAATQWE